MTPVIEKEKQRTVIEQLGDFDTALLANTIGYLDPLPAHEYYMGSTITSITPTLGPTVGVAMTCEMDSSTPAGASDLNLFWYQLDEIQNLSLPVIWVVKTVGSRPDHECVLGDGMAKLLHTSGCVGVVTDGGVRDIRGLEAIPFAAYCRGTVIHHCPLRIRTANQPIEIGGVKVAPGDLIHANFEGVIRIPGGCAAALPEAATRMRACEHEAHLLFRRTDLPNAEKRARVDPVFTKYGFTSRAGQEFRDEMRWAAGDE